MNRLYRIALPFLFLIVLILGACADADSNTESGNKDEVTIGLSAPLTGDSAQYGENFDNAVKLAVEQYNAKDNDIKVVLKKEDSANQPKESANIAQKFSDDKDMIAVIGEFSSTASMSGAPIYQRSGLVQISPSSSHPDFTKTGDYIFRNVPVQKDEATFISEYAAELGFEKMAIMHIQDDWGISARDETEAAFEATGGEVTSIQSFNPEQRDFSNILTEIKQGDPDILYLGTPYTEAALIAKQARKMGIDIPLLGVSILYSDEYIDLGGEDVDGTYLNSYFYPDDSDPLIGEFVEAYEEAYNKTPNSFAALAYDSANMVLSLVEEGITDRDGIRDGLADMKDFPGVTGLTSYDENRNVQKEMAKLIVEDEDFELYQGSN